jgi:arylsulfatase A-like enzyme
VDSEVLVSPAVSTWRNNLAMGAFWGMLAWQAYAVIEYAASTLAPLVLYRNMAIARWHWELSFLLFGAYSIAGILLGGAAGLILGATGLRGERLGASLKAMGTITVALGFLANQAAGTRNVVVMGFCAVWAGMAGGSVISEAWRERFRLFANAWAAVLMMLAAAWLNLERFRAQPVGERAVLSGLLLCVCAGVSMGSRRFRSRSLGAKLWPEPLAVAGAAVVVAGCGILFSATVRAQGNGNASAAAPHQPNVLLIVMDTVRADHLSLYDYSRGTSPNLKEFAGGATLFRHASAAGDMTLTSHASILTGTYASWNGIRSHQNWSGGGMPMSRNYPTMAEILAGHGYFTAGIVANTGFLTPEWGFDRGFEFFDYRSAIRILTPEKNYYLRAGAHEVLHRFMDTADFDMMFLRTAEINAEALDVMERAHGSARPFFLFLNYMDAHQPYAPPRPFNRMYPGGVDHTIGDEWYSEASWELEQGAATLPDRARAHFISQYDGGIAYMDAEIGELIRHLKRAGLYDNTLIIVTADHGEAFGDRNLLGHGLGVYQDEVNVPLIVKYPGQNRGESVSREVGHTDILPTVLEVTGTPMPGFLQGVSLRGGEGNRGRKLISESFPHPALIQANPKFDRAERALYEDGFKYIGSTLGKRELYDLSKDPMESHDVCEAETERCRAMQEELNGWVHAAPKFVAQKAGSKKMPVNQENLERLRSLGYIGK